MKLDDGRLTFVAQQEVTALDAIHKAVLGKAACAGRVTEGVGTCISIHAPTWGATQSVRRVRTLHVISIHAPTWGATRPKSSRAILRGKFQSTHPRGVRLNLLFGNLDTCKFQSTHPRGVRLLVPFLCVSVTGFQSTHPRGVRHVFLEEFKGSLKFQSTHPRGVRRSGKWVPGVCLQISIHAPTWGATDKVEEAVLSAIFQSTHPRGVRQCPKIHF